MWGWAQITKSETSSERKQDATVLGEVKDLEFRIHGWKYFLLERERRKDYNINAERLRGDFLKLGKESNHYFRRGDGSLKN